MNKGEELLNQCFNIFAVSNFIDMEIAHSIFEEYNKNPYLFCKKYNLLHNNSAEEFSIAWMNWWNSVTEQRYY